MKAPHLNLHPAPFEAAVNAGPNVTLAMPSRTAHAEQHGAYFFERLGNLLIRHALRTPGNLAVGDTALLRVRNNPVPRALGTVRNVTFTRDLPEHCVMTGESQTGAWWLVTFSELYPTRPGVPRPAPVEVVLPPVIPDDRPSAWGAPS